MQSMTKAKLTEAIRTFENSKRTLTDYVLLFRFVSRAYDQGIGLTGVEIEEAIQTALALPADAFKGMGTRLDDQPVAKETTNRTHVTCPQCGTHIVILYRLRPPADHQIDVLEGGHFRSGNNWPAYVFCDKCGRRFLLSKLEPMPEYRIRAYHRDGGTQPPGETTYDHIESDRYQLRKDAEILKGYYKSFGWPDEDHFQVFENDGSGTIVSILYIE